MKWLSRKFFVVQQGLSLFAGVPILFKYFQVSDQVTLASLAGLTLVIGYYFKINKDTKLADTQTNT